MPSANVLNFKLCRPHFPPGRPHLLRVRGSMIAGRYVGNNGGDGRQARDMSNVEESGKGKDMEDV